MAGKVAKRAPKKKANAYKLPDPIAAGEIMTDMAKRQWILGTSIGVGGFGEIYSAAPYNGKSPKDYLNVIKVEPHGNGPLFVEMHFYMRNAKSDEINDWKRKKKLSALGMPPYISSGSHQYKNTKYRFVVMDRYGKDLWKLFEESNRKFPEHTVYKIGLQIINVLEYIHYKTYVHADIKGANLLLDFKSPNQVYLVDFGLASHYTTKPEYKFDPKKAHNGTIEYTSRDAHMGVPTMRGDFEILIYNMIQWLCGTLLWEKSLTTPAIVHKEKEKAFNDIPEFLQKSFSGTIPEPISKFMTLLSNIEFNETPNYEKFRKILTDGLKTLSEKPDGKLEFKATSNFVMPQVVKSTPKKLKVTEGKRRESPRVKKIKSPNHVMNNLDDSNVGILMDKKRAGAKDIRELLDDIQSDEEYDIKIVKKTKIREESNSKHVSKAKTDSPPARRRKNARIFNTNDSQSDSEPEVTKKGSKSRPVKVTAKKRKAQPKQLLIRESASDEDMFDV